MNTDRSVIAFASLLLSGVSLSGCGDVAPTNVADPAMAGNAADNLTAAATPLATSSPPSQSGGWVGKYTGDFDGGEGIVEIGAPDASGRHKVGLTVAGEGCAGELSGTATASGNTMTLKQRDDNGELCTITMSRDGNGISVSENGCLFYHGMSCGFIGTATKNGDGSPSSKAIVVPRGQWVAAESTPGKIGIQADTKSMSYDTLFLTCEQGPGNVGLILVDGIESLSGKSTVTFTVNGRSFPIPILVERGDDEEVYASANLRGDHPFLAALPFAKSLSMGLADQTYTLPVKGLKSAWSGFKRACGLN